MSGDSQRSQGLIDKAEARTATPGTMMILAGIVMLLAWIFSVGVVASGTDVTVEYLQAFEKLTQPGSPENKQIVEEIEKAKTRDKTFEYVLNAVFMPLGLFANVMVILAGFRMKSLRSHTLCIVGSVCAIVPFNSCCCIGFPIGVWALITLVNATVKEGFLARAGTNREEDAGWGADSDLDRDRDLDR